MLGTAYIISRSRVILLLFCFVKKPVACLQSANTNGGNQQKTSK